MQYSRLNSEMAETFDWKKERESKRQKFCILKIEFHKKEPRYKALAIDNKKYSRSQQKQTFLKLNL